MKIVKFIPKFIAFWLFLTLIFLFIGLFIGSVKGGYNAPNPNSIERFWYIVSKNSFAYVREILFRTFIFSILVLGVSFIIDRLDKKHKVCNSDEEYSNYTSKDPVYWDVIGEEMPTEEERKDPTVKPPNFSHNNESDDSEENNQSKDKKE